MTALLASVQTTADLAPLSWPQVFAAVAFMFIVVALLIGTAALAAHRERQHMRRRLAWRQEVHDRQRHPNVRAHRAATRQRLESRR